MAKIERDRSGEVFGKYRLVRPLGAGGFGDVYVAQQISGGVARTVALKIGRATLAKPADAQRFRDEGAALAKLSHPNIATLFEFDTTPGGEPYLVMEYLPDALPIDAFAQKHALDVPTRLRFLIEACQGVSHAHRRDIIHRDLSCRNILVTIDGNRTLTKVIDFGLALLDPDHQADGQRPRRVMGTHEYMSPEQTINSEAVDMTSDVYALGIVLYQLLTGVRPFVGSRHKTEDERRREREKLFRRIREEAPRLPSQTLADEGAAAHQVAPVRGALDAIVMKALAKAPTDRYPSVWAFADDLKNYLDDNVVTAMAGDRGYRVRRFVRRHRAWSAGLLVMAIAAFVLPVSVILLVASHRRLTRENQELVQRGATLDAELQRVLALPQSLKARVLDLERKNEQATTQLKSIGGERDRAVARASELEAEQRKSQTQTQASSDVANQLIEQYKASASEALAQARFETAEAILKAIPDDIPVAGLITSQQAQMTRTPSVEARLAFLMTLRSASERATLSPEDGRLIGKALAEVQTQLKVSSTTYSERALVLVYNATAARWSLRQSHRGAAIELAKACAAAFEAMGSPGRLKSYADEAQAILVRAAP